MDYTQNPKPVLKCCVLDDKSCAAIIIYKLCGWARPTPLHRYLLLKWDKELWYANRSVNVNITYEMYKTPVVSVLFGAGGGLLPQFRSVFLKINVLDEV